MDAQKLAGNLINSLHETEVHLTKKNKNCRAFKKLAIMWKQARLLWKLLKNILACCVYWYYWYYCIIDAARQNIL